MLKYLLIIKISFAQILSEQILSEDQKVETDKGSHSNLIIYADYSGPDAIRVGDNYNMILCV